MTPAMVFGYEVEGVTFGTIAALFFGALLGWAGGFFGSSMRQRWALAERPASGTAASPAKPPADASAPMIPSGPRWEQAHQPPPPSREA